MMFKEMWMQVTKVEKPKKNPIREMAKTYIYYVLKNQRKHLNWMISYSELFKLLRKTISQHLFKVKSTLEKIGVQL